MTSINLASNPDQIAEQIQQLEIDKQLALLWVIYTKIGTSITPAAPDAASPEISAGLVSQVKKLEQQAQLDTMRDIAKGSDTVISREYGALSAETKLAFWYQLAQGMEAGSIIPMPEDYTMSDEVGQVLGVLESSDFEQQITVLRKVADAMGAEPASGAKV
ncbi:MAG: orange carotenoid protein N-terminal domain-containing protein [Elainellaceae cyanobacterium]